MREWLMRVRDWLRREALDAELTEELRFHRELLERDARAAGDSPAEARHAARRRLGSALRIKEQARARWSLPWLDALQEDVRYAFRALRRSPAFTATVVATLGLGVGANGAVFSVLKAALLQPLPYRDPASLVMVWGAPPGQLPPDGRVTPGIRGAFTAPGVLAVQRDAAEAVGEVAAILMQSDQGLTPRAFRALDTQLDLTLGDRTVRLNGAGVTPNFFSLLGVRAARGRVFGDGDEASAEPLIVLSDALWRRHFGADPAVVGRSITLVSGIPTSRVATAYTVAGVLPRSFRFTYPDEIEAWTLMRWSDVARQSPMRIGLNAVARLRPGLALVEARRRAAAAGAGPDRPATTGRRDPVTFALEPMSDWVVGETRPALRLLGGVAALLLLVTCVTVANGLLARVTDRSQELAARTALGAPRWRLVRQVLTEGVLLAVGGAVAGTALAAALQPALRAWLPPSIPRVGEIGVDVWVVAFGAAAATLTTILAAVAPAVGGTRIDASAALLRSGSAASAGRAAVRWRHGLVATQAAVATALLISAALLLASLRQLGRVPLGFDAERVVTVDLVLLDDRYAWSWALRQFQDELLSGLRAVPGIADVGLTSAVPLRSGGRPVGFSRVGSDELDRGHERVVSPGFFRVMHMPALRGRLITEEDREGTPPVAVVSESFARRRFGAADPIGRRMGTTPELEIVGVVSDVRERGRDRDATPAVYVPQAQQPRVFVSVVARPRPGVELAAIVPAMRRAIRAVDPAVPATNFATVDELVERSGAGRRFYTVATAAFAALALLLTLVGLAVVVARVVAERRRELAIRSALGATLGILARAVMGAALRAVGFGAAAGLAGAYGAAMLFAPFLFGVSPRSPAIYAGVALFVVGVALLAAWWPVRRFGRAPVAGLLKAE